MAGDALDVEIAREVVGRLPRRVAEERQPDARVIPRAPIRRRAHALVARGEVQLREAPRLRGAQAFARGVQVLHLATVTAACAPRVAPVDGLFFRGRFYFGSSQGSARFRHIRARPQVSATVTSGEEFAVVVHGRAWILDLDSAESAPFRAYCRDVYGDEWGEWGE